MIEKWKVLLRNNAVKNKKEKSLIKHDRRTLENLWDCSHSVTIDTWYSEKKFKECKTTHSQAECQACYEILSNENIIFNATIKRPDSSIVF